MNHHFRCSPFYVIAVPMMMLCYVRTRTCDNLETWNSIMERSENTKSQIPNLGHVDQIWDDQIWDLVHRGPKIPNPKKVQPPAPVLDSGISCSERFPSGKMAQLPDGWVGGPITGQSYPTNKHIAYFPLLEVSYYFTCIIQNCLISPKRLLILLLQKETIYENKGLLPND